jgi:hypothetical protein
MIKQLTLERCSCEHKQCKRWGFKEGMFYQGSGFTLEEAQEIARRYNTYNETKKGVKKGVKKNGTRRKNTKSIC